ncbi:hypothetical protein [Tateyamaria sp. SN6-1]|uniref:hypothetical protein n=1 Tax=Tateyamaria sp. SN6-1 TaxID=3092148 RepID=UPI0039F495F3
MHIPLTRNEIAGFLEINTMQVDLLSATGRLQKSLSCPLRISTEFTYSTVYDVLEFALSAGHLPVTLARETAALWVAQMAEADEWDTYVRASTVRRIEMLIELARDDGLDVMTPNHEKVATSLILSQMALISSASEIKAVS